VAQHCLACGKGCQERKSPLAVIFSIGWLCLCLCMCVAWVSKVRVSLYSSYPRTSIVCGLISGLSVMCKLLIAISRKSTLCRATRTFRIVWQAKFAREEIASVSGRPSVGHRVQGWLEIRVNWLTIWSNDGVLWSRWWNNEFIKAANGLTNNNDYFVSKKDRALCHEIGSLVICIRCYITSVVVKVSPIINYDFFRGFLNVLLLTIRVNPKTDPVVEKSVPKTFLFLLPVLLIPGAMS